MNSNLSETPIFVVIVAGGQGTRMGMALPKQFLALHGKPILYYTIASFIAAVPQAKIILVLPENDISKLQMVLQHFEERIDLTVVSGGETRYDSVKNGLKDIPMDAIVLVHDGVRPFVSSDLIHRCIEQTKQSSNAIPALPVTDSVRVLNQNGSAAINRDLLRIIQTPQTFLSNILLPAFEQEYHGSFTDEATVVERMGHTVNLISGEKNNIKITTPEDLILAENILTQMLTAE